MNFTPEDGFCCPSVEKLIATSESDPRISKFMAWAKSLPVKPDHYSKYATAPIATPLQDQPFVIKIVEDGWAFMFHGAFAPREDQGASGGFVRIPYFDLITSDYKEMHYEGDESEVFVCEKHGKRFLLGLYVRDPTEKEPCPKELRKTAAGLKVLEESCAGTENDDLRVTVTAPVASGGEGGDDATILGSMEHSSKCHGVRRSQEQSPPLQSDSGTWTWL